MANKVLSEVAAEIREAEYFSVIVDELTDASRQEQVSLCARFIDRNCEPQELFLGFYATEETSAETLATIILDALRRLNLSVDKLRGQCYDGPSNMAGRVGDVQALLKKKQPKAVFVHCAAHRLNLATLTAVTPKLKSALGEASGVIEFIRSSPKRLAMFDHEQEDGTAGLHSCRTRWTCNERSLQSLISNWTAVLATLAAIEEDPATPTEPTARARGYRRAMEEFDFFFLVRLGLRLYQLVTPTITAIQTEEVSIAEVLAKVELLKTAALGQSQNAPFQQLWLGCLAKALHWGWKSRA